MLTTPSNITELNIDVANGSLVSNFLSLSTHQTIETNIYIPEILTSDVNVRLFNSMKRFAENVVLLGRNTVVECK